jgi:hypothetical protein
MQRNTVKVSDPIAPQSPEDLPCSGAKLYGSATAGAVSFMIGDVVELEDDEDEAPLPLLGLVQTIFQNKNGNDPEILVRVMIHGEETVLGDAASEHEIFMTDVRYECPASDVLSKCCAKRLQVPTGPGKARNEAVSTVRALLAGNTEAKAAGKPIQMLYRMLYLPEEGMFKSMPDDLRLGCYLHDEKDEDGFIKDVKTKEFMWDDQQYRIGDFVYTIARYAKILFTLCTISCLHTLVVRAVMNGC